MQFIDEVTLRVISGSGGDGAVSFRREKYVPFGGPDGGDGGRGGDVVVVATTDRNTLLHLKRRHQIKAPDGGPGSKRQRNGKNAESVVIEVPVGTRIFDAENDNVLADLTDDGQTWVAARGGDGGQGNIHFKSPTNQAPRKAIPGFRGEDRTLRLELVSMADVGLLGFPNAGKSTFISRVSAARPRVASYPFTTLSPNLGVVQMGYEGSFVVADIPGLIEGSAEGAGLGHQFLRHLSRNRLLLHLLSLDPLEAKSPVERYQAIRKELAAYDEALADLPEIVVLTKADLVGSDERDEATRALERAGTTQVRIISSVTGEGIDALRRHIWAALQKMTASGPPNTAD